MTTFIGIDPGKSGGIAVIDRGEAYTFKLSETEHDIARWLGGWVAFGKPFAVLEKVGAMPKQGVTSTFTFGQGYGFVRGILVAHGVPFELVTPQKWQKAMGCLTGGDKNVSKAAAQRLFPSMKVTHANADALLLASYAQRIRQPMEMTP
jgi:crossover junction endodeoxyribonuclease RuvC